MELQTGNCRLRSVGTVTGDTSDSQGKLLNCRPIIIKFNKHIFCSPLVTADRYLHLVTPEPGSGNSGLMYAKRIQILCIAPQRSLGYLAPPSSTKPLYNIIRLRLAFWCLAGLVYFIFSSDSPVWSLQ